MPDAWRAYLEMALGLTETPRKRAQKAVGDLVNRGGATAAQLQGLVEDLLSAGMANREALTNIVRYEVDKALGRVGLATADEVNELTARVRDLEKDLRAAQAKVARADGAAEAKPVAKKVAKKAVAATPNAMPAAGTTPVAPAKKTVAKKTVAKKAVRKVAPAGTTEAPTAPVKAAAAEVPLPEASPANKAPAKKAPAKKAVKKAAPSTQPEA